MLCLNNFIRVTTSFELDQLLINRVNKLIQDLKIVSETPTSSISLNFQREVDFDINKSIHWCNSSHLVCEILPGCYNIQA